MTGAGPAPLGGGNAGLPPAVAGGARIGPAVEPRAEPAQPRPPGTGTGEQAVGVDRRAGVREQDAGPAPRRPFADLLVPAVPAAPATPVAPPAAADPAEPGDDGNEALPAELLALLEGHWLGGHVAAPPPAASSTPAALAAATAALPGHAAPPPGNLTLHLAPAAALPTASAQSAQSAAPAPVADTAAGGARAALDAPAATATAAVASPAVEAPALAARDAASAAEGATAVETAPGTPLGATPTAAARPHATAAPLPLPMPASPEAGFDDGFGHRIAWMADQRVGHAEIRLNPEHVGPIDVRVKLDGDQVRAEFHSAHAEVRQAIEASLPRLRELLGQHGLQLGQADVGQRQAGRGDAATPAGAHPDDAADAADAPRARATALPLRGLVDAYA